MATARSKTKTTARKPVDPAVLMQRQFARLVKTMFTNMGFSHIPTEGKESKFGLKKGELDAVYLFENIILIVEDTTSAKPFEHAKNKSILADQILSNKASFLIWMKDQFPEYQENLDAYSPSRFKLFYLYISKREMDLDVDEIALLSPMTIVTTRALNYFDKLARSIRRSARTDLWRYLNITSSDIGPVSAGSAAKTIDTAIISPDDSTGFSNGVRLVSFMISADVLLRNSYVLRKDNWDYSTELYQRLVDANRIKKIRKYIATDGAAFMNNIIVGLPGNVTFQTADGSPVNLDEAQSYAPYRMTIPDEFNSLCLIDGQHRVFAHHEGTDDLESKVASIRGKVHLLATGLVFPPKMKEIDRLRLQSEIFLDINSNTKPVPADVLLAIQSLRSPFADVAVARRVLEALNRKNAFKGLFQLSQMDNAPIKIASIVKFALRYLVDIDTDNGLCSKWIAMDPDREAIRQKNDTQILGQYVQFCANTLDMFFRALKKHHAAGWGETSTKVTSTTAINGMIIALRRSIPALGILTFDEYSELFAKWKVDFSVEKFQFASSQYARFSQVILQEVFELTETESGWRK